MNDLIFFSAKTMAEMIREKKISSEELVQAHVEQIQKINPKLNAVVQLYQEEAFEKARLADAVLARKKKIGPLHGVPFTVKDTFEVKDAIITAGTTGLKNNRCKENATLVARLLKAGAILIGITNEAEAGLSFESDNLVYGRTNNPYDLQRTSGGSSGGEAAIISAGGSPLGIGSDFAGSIRLPAHFCGIAGIKPTTGRLSCGGHLFYPSIRAFLISVGPMARYVEDLIYVLPFLAGDDWKDPLTVPFSLRKPGGVKLDKLKIAYFIDNKIVTPTTDTANTMHSVIRCLSQTAKKVEEKKPLPVDQSYSLFMRFLEYGGASATPERLKKLGTIRLHHLVDGLIAKYPQEPYTAEQMTTLFGDWLKYRVDMLQFMEDFDVLISPVNAFPAMKHGTSIEEENFRSFSYTMTHTLTGWPSVVVRCGTSNEGLPIGVQITAKPWREDIALAVALFLQTSLGGWKKPVHLTYDLAK